MAAHAARGKQALDSSDFASAIAAYSLAIQESPASPDYYIQRSTAHQRAQQYEAALRDAEQGVLNAQKRAKKELITSAQFRRGVALHSLGRYGDALFVLQLVQQRSGISAVPKDIQDVGNFKPSDAKSADAKAAEIWIRKTELQLAKLPSDDAARAVTVVETPDPVAAPVAATSAMSTPPVSKAAPPAAVKPPAPQQTPADKIRHDWYQNTENIYFTLLAKGVPSDRAQIELAPRSLSISFPLVTGASYDLTLDPLFAAIVPERSITRILATKIELVLVKAEPGRKWSAIEGEPETATAPAGSEQPASTSGPAYPTSSKTGPKDWDKITQSLSTKPKTVSSTDPAPADSAATSTPSDDAGYNSDDDDTGGDPANAFFKKLYKGATPDVQRAMMKSFTESNGTALSTNWAEVGKAPVETVPPDGMEARKW